MDEQKDENRYSYNMGGRYSRSDRKRSSAVSLERGPSLYDGMRESSLNQRHTLVQVMSLEGSEKNEDFYESLLFEQRRRSLMRNSGTQRHQMDEEPLPPERKSNYNKIIRHDCRCEARCVESLCPCSEDVKEMCLIGHCCEMCIKLKNEWMQRQARNQGCLCQNSKCQNSYCKCFKAKKKCDPQFCSCVGCQNRLEGYDEQRYAKVQDKKKKQARIKKAQETRKVQQKDVCSCKKSHCLKAYCACFAAGKPCGAKCTCQECRNRYEEDQNIEERREQKLRYSVIEHEDDGEMESQNVNIDEYFVEDNYETKELPRSMEFEHPDFSNSFTWQ